MRDDFKERMNKYPLCVFGMTAGVTALLGECMPMLGLPAAALGIPLAVTGLTGFWALQDAIGRTNLDNFFTSIELKNCSGDYPSVEKVKENEFTKTYYIKLPSGICTDDLERVHQEIEQFLNRRVTISFESGVSVVTSYRPLKSMYKFEAITCNRPLEICPAYGVWGPYHLDIENAIHILLAGATGAGKSVALRTIITALILTKNPREVILNLVDFQRVELGIFKKCRMVDNYCTTVPEFGKLLNNLKAESNRRLSLLEECGVVNIQGYNKKHQKSKLPYIVNIVDEFAALADKDDKQCKAALNALKQRIAQDRKLGIHYIICTQRPTVDIIDGSIKTNMPTRIALKMVTSKDSETILDEKGAENLRMGGNAFVKMARMEEIQFMFLSEEQAYELVKPTFIEKKPKNQPQNIVPMGVIGNADAARQGRIKLC